MTDQSIDTPATVVDCIGLKCPLPVLRARKALLQVPIGALVQVESSDPMAVLDVPHMAASEGHEVVAQRVNGDRATFWIKRGSA
ncbi:MAG: sulfurtransferase TusA family protein [Devosiaceae bacterium]